MDQSPLHSESSYTPSMPSSPLAHKTVKSHPTHSTAASAKVSVPILGPSSEEADLVKQYGLQGADSYEMLGYDDNGEEDDDDKEDTNLDDSFEE